MGILPSQLIVFLFYFVYLFACVDFSWRRREWDTRLLRHSNMETFKRMMRCGISEDEAAIEKINDATSYLGRLNADRRDAMAAQSRVTTHAKVARENNDKTALARCGNEFNAVQRKIERLNGMISRVERSLIQLETTQDAVLASKTVLGLQSETSKYATVDDLLDEAAEEAEGNRNAEMLNAALEGISSMVAAPGASEGGMDALLAELDAREMVGGQAGVGVPDEVWDASPPLFDVGRGQMSDAPVSNPTNKSPVAIINSVSE